MLLEPARIKNCFLEARLSGYGEDREESLRRVARAEVCHWRSECARGTARLTRTPSPQPRPHCASPWPRPRHVCAAAASTSVGFDRDLEKAVREAARVNVSAAAAITLRASATHSHSLTRLHPASSSRTSPTAAIHIG